MPTAKHEMAGRQLTNLLLQNSTINNKDANNTKNYKKHYGGAQSQVQQYRTAQQEQRRQQQRRRRQQELQRKQREQPAIVEIMTMDSYGWRNNPVRDSSIRFY